MSDANNKPHLSYRDAGVDIDAGNSLVECIKGTARATQRAEVLGGLGGFGALFAVPKNYQEPVLVAGTDGVGTKLKLATDLSQHDSIGIDLVAMCVNDLIVQGAEPLFFLDYYATGKLAVNIASTVVSGIGKGCQQAGCSLIGGETAEMPGMYQGEDYDLAGFCVGIVEKSKIIDGQLVKPGDAILGLASSGVHSNGYSLVRKIIELSEADLSQPFDGVTLGEALLRPTRIYVKPLLELIRKVPVHALSHITGGGLLENLPRVLPKHSKALIHTQAYPMPPVFSWIKEQGNVHWQEMFRTFNCGIGMAVVVPEDSKLEAITLLKDAGETVYELGQIESHIEAAPQVELQGLPG